MQATIQTKYWKLNYTYFLYVIGFFILWQFLVSFNLLKAISPGSIFVAAEATWKTLLASIAVSFGRMLGTYLLVLVLAVIFCIFIFMVPSTENFLISTFDIAQSMPGTALLPMTLAVFKTANWPGYPDVPIMIALGTAMIWPIFFGIYGGMKNINKEIFEAGKVFGARGFRLVGSIMLPAVVPAIITSSMVGFGEGWEALIASELVAKAYGFGTFIEQSTKGESGQMLFGWIVFIVMIMMIDRFVWVPLLKKTEKQHT